MSGAKGRFSMTASANGLILSCAARVHRGHLGAHGSAHPAGAAAGRGHRHLPTAVSFLFLVNIVVGFSVFYRVTCLAVSFPCPVGVDYFICASLHLLHDCLRALFVFVSLFCSLFLVWTNGFLLPGTTKISSGI